MKSEIWLTALDVAQAMVETARRQAGGVLTDRVIAEKVGQVVGLPDFQPLAGDGAKELIRELEARYSTWVGRTAALVDNDDHEAWLVPDRKHDWRFWARYRRFLEQRWPIPAVDALDESTDEILELLEDPNRAGVWDRRGLVVGHVQSGKTASYTGLICKAADAGYKVIIVLAGIHNNLRSQTQMRLDEQFLGYETEERNVSGAADANIIGVGTIPPPPSVVPNYMTTRHERGDFTLARAQNFGVTPGENPLLFVVKKQHSVLKNLETWIRRSLRGEEIHSRTPLLVIDDEADHASVDTRDGAFDQAGQADPEHDPTTINRRIRGILRRFAKSAYVGYTATPFANIFIHEQAETDECGPDLFPRSFIVNLPTNSAYDGPVRIFGLEATDESEGQESLPLVRTVDDHEIGEAGAWMPAKHKNGHRPLHDGGDEPPPSLIEAIRAFVLTCAIRRARGQVTEHNSMLVHVTRFTSVQDAVRVQVESALTDIRRRIRYDADATGDEFEVMQRLWQDDFAPTSERVRKSLPEREFPVTTWEAIVPEIRSVVEVIDVRTINGTAQDILDYEKHEKIGLSTIAIGGDKLARGLTLEGLSVSYFLRASRMYDTLMQMGRWFGYRPGYLDLCRLYMTSELEDWFRHVTSASEELRREFDRMTLLRQTPKEYGLRVRAHPEMLVTSRVKMRHGMDMDVDFSGSLSETIVFPRSSDLLQENLDAANAFVASLGSPTERDPVRMRDDRPQRWEGTLYWDNASSNAVVEFLKNYRTHENSHKADAALLRKFIQQKNVNHELGSWHVAVLSGDGGEAEFGGEKIRMMERSPRNRHSSDKSQKERGEYVIGRLLAPRDESIDLNEDDYAEALERTQRAWTEDPGRSRRQNAPTTPSGVFIRQLRGERHPDRGLLLLYPLDPASPDVAFPGPIMGIGISFPGGGAPVSVKYRVTNLFWQQEHAAE